MSRHSESNGTWDGYFRWYQARFVRSRGHHPSEKTLSQRAVHFNVLAQMSGCTDEESFATLLQDRVAVELLLDKLALRVSPGTQRSYIYTLLSLSEYLRLQGKAETAAVHRSDLTAQNPQKAITVYSPEELEEFVQAARGRDLRWWALLAYLVDTGRRIGETLSVRWDQLKLDAHPAYVELPVNKTNRPQYVPLTKRLTKRVFTPANVAALQGDVRVGRRRFHRDPAVYVFPWTYGTVYLRFENFCEATGLPNRGVHNFRHTVITSRIARGVPIQAVAALAGHSSPAVTMSRYNHATALDYAKWMEG